MLKSMAMKNQEDEEKSKDVKLQAMQAQLDELKKMRVLRLSRIAKEETKYGLLDSGATHAMRGKKKGEKTEAYEGEGHPGRWASGRHEDGTVRSDGHGGGRRGGANHPNERSSRPARLCHSLGPRQDEADAPTSK